MKVIFNNTPTAVNIKELFQQLIEEYHKLNTQLEEGFRTANQKYKENYEKEIFTEEYLQNTLTKETDAANSAFLEKATALNKQAVQYITNVKQKVLLAFSPNNKPADYAVKINNALQFIQLEGAEITDKIAFQILREFVSDVETMQRFRNVIEHQKGEQLMDAYGKTTFPLTFGRLTNCESLTAAISELEETASKLFIRGKQKVETERLNNGKTLGVPMDGYMQLVSEKNIEAQAATVETMMSELFTTTD